MGNMTHVGGYSGCKDEKGWYWGDLVKSVKPLSLTWASRQEVGGGLGN